MCYQKLQEGLYYSDVITVYLHSIEQTFFGGVEDSSKNVCSRDYITHVMSLVTMVYNHISPSDPSITSHAVHQVMQVVREGRWGWRFVGGSLSVPQSILNNIEAKYSSDDEKMSALASYVATILPGITWERIATAFYECDEHAAVEQVKTHLHIVPGELWLLWLPQSQVPLCKFLDYL